MRDDVQKKLKEFNIPTLGSIKSIEKAEEKLQSNEVVAFVSIGAGKITNPKRGVIAKIGIPGTFIITDKRMYFHYTHVDMIDTVQYNDIVSVNYKWNALKGNEIFITTKDFFFQISVKNNKVVQKYLPYIIEMAIKEYKEKYGNEIQIPSKNTGKERVDIKNQGKNPKEEDYIVLIKNLAELKENGVLTESEFEEKKKEILDRI